MSNGIALQSKPHGVRAAALLGLFLLVAAAAAHADEPPAAKTDPHYNAVGFFDIHVCNWPARPLFLMVLFSTTQYERIRAVEAFTPDGARLGALNLERFRLVVTPGKPEKHVFIGEMEIPAGAGAGWYSARITLTDDTVHEAKDYVDLLTMDRADGQQPANGANGIALPDELRWSPVSGAHFYQVFIQDLWEGRLIYTSPLVEQASLKVPAGLLQPGGYYAWRVHARDVNESPLLGDFNHGSLSAFSEFTVAEP